MIPEKKHNFKIILIGDFSTGKSSICRRYIDGHFPETIKPTIGSAFFQKTLVIQQQQVKLQIWDTAGQQKYRTLAPIYFRDSDGVFLVFDVTNEKSFIDIEKQWYGQARKNCCDGVPMCLIGNKNDQRMKFSKEMVNQFCEKNRINVQYTSAKTGENIDKAFLQIATKILEK